MLVIVIWLTHTWLKRSGHFPYRQHSWFVEKSEDLRDRLDMKPLPKPESQSSSPPDYSSENPAMRSTGPTNKAPPGYNRPSSPRSTFGAFGGARNSFDDHKAMVPARPAFGASGGARNSFDDHKAMLPAPNTPDTRGRAGPPSGPSDQRQTKEPQSSRPTKPSELESGVNGPASGGMASGNVQNQGRLGNNPSSTAGPSQGAAQSLKAMVQGLDVNISINPASNSNAEPAAKPPQPIKQKPLAKGTAN